MGISVTLSYSMMNGIHLTISLQNGPGVVHVYMHLPIVGVIIMVLSNIPLEPLLLRVTHAMFAPWYLRGIAKIILNEQALQVRCHKQRCFVLSICISLASLNDGCELMPGEKIYLCSTVSSGILDGVILKIWRCFLKKKDFFYALQIWKLFWRLRGYIFTSSYVFLYYDYPEPYVWSL